jgi:RND family efflux transporter MFP subunit
MNAIIEPNYPAADSAAERSSDHPVSRQPPRKGRGGPGKWLLFFIVLALILVGFLLWKRGQESNALGAETDHNNVTTVSVTHATAGPADNEITLPGNLTAYSEASIFARTNGYLKSWSTDIGAKVKANEVMAEIEAPDVDAQLRQADATLSQARANLDIANLNFARQQDLLQKKVASQQEFDQNRTNVDAMKAAVQAAQANMQNLTVMKDFQLLRAPFDGVVTKRNTDVGALISASNGGQELFRVARTDILRVYVYVPQVYAAFVQEGSTAYLDFAEFPGEKFPGKVAHVAGAMDPATRTLETEIEVDNKAGRLFPGAFANVHLSLPLKKAPMVVPVNTLIFRSEGTQVAVVGADGVVHLRNVTVGQDYGTSLEIKSGITPADRIIVNPSDSLADGAKVQVAPDAAAK